MSSQNTALKMAITQMIQLGRAYQIDMYSPYSIINKCCDRDEKRKLENLFYNQITATANVIRLFSEREISFQWQGTKDSLYAGFALYEIAEDALCEKIPFGVPDTTYNRFTGKHENDRRIDWGKAKEQGKIVKIYDYTFNADTNPHHVERYLATEFEPI